MLIADETALPAVGRWLEEAPAGTQAIVLVEVPDDDDRQDLPTDAHADIRWFVRPAGVRPGYSSLLREAVEALELPEGRGYAWCAGETLTIAPIRRHLRARPGLTPQDVEVCGYWRRTTFIQDPRSEQTEPATSAAPDDEAGSSPQPTSLPSQPASPAELAHELHEMAELLPPIAIRATITLGLPALISAGTSSPQGLASEVGVPIARLQPLLDALRSLGLVRMQGRTEPSGRRAPEADDIGESQDEAVELTALGEAMLEEPFQESLDLHSPLARRELGLVYLLDVLRGGVDPADSAGPPPAAMRTWRERDPRVAEAAHDRAERVLLYNLQALSAVPLLVRSPAVAVLGDGSVPTAAILAREDPERRVALLVPPQDVEIVAERLEAVPPPLRRRIELRAWDPTAPVPVGPHETLLIQLALDGVDDTAHRRIVGSASGDLVIIAELADEAPEDDHAAADALVALTANGVPLRTSSQHRELLRREGFGEARSGRLGRGFGASLITASR